METAVTIPEDIFEQGEELARRLGLSRNELYARALADLLRAHRDLEVTHRLNEVYAREESALDPVLAQMQATALEAEEW
jgi:metal-responsive CopG/Arc/MetJ family transcriptional regulator